MYIRVNYYMNKTRNIKKRKIKKTQRKYNDVTTHGARKTKQNQIVKKRKISKTKRMHKSRSNQFGGDNDDDNDDDNKRKTYIDYMKRYIGKDGKYNTDVLVEDELYQNLLKDSQEMQLIWEIIEDKINEVNKMKQKQREQQQNCKNAVNVIQESFRKRYETLIDEMNKQIDKSNQRCNEPNNPSYWRRMWDK